MGRLNYEQVSGFFCGLAAAAHLIDPAFPKLHGEPGSGVMRVVNTETSQPVAAVARSLFTSQEVIEQWFRGNVAPVLRLQSAPPPEPVAIKAPAPVPDETAPGGEPQSAAAGKAFGPEEPEGDEDEGAGAASSDDEHGQTEAVPSNDDFDDLSDLL